MGGGSVPPIGLGPAEVQASHILRSSPSPKHPYDGTEPDRAPARGLHPGVRQLAFVVLAAAGVLVLVLLFGGFI